MNLFKHIEISNRRTQQYNIYEHIISYVRYIHTYIQFPTIAKIPVAMEEAEISMSISKYPLPLVYVCTSFFPVRAGLLPTAIWMAQLPWIICGIILNLLSQKLFSAVQNLRRSFIHALLELLAVVAVVVVVVVDDDDDDDDALAATVGGKTDDDDDDDDDGVVVVVDAVRLLSISRITFKASLLAVKRHTTCTHEEPGT